jgi:hypothetical protein
LSKSFEVYQQSKACGFIAFTFAFCLFTFAFLLSCLSGGDMNRTFNHLNFTTYRKQRHSAFCILKKSSLMVFLLYALYLVTAQSVVAQVGLSHIHPNLARGAGNDKVAERYPWDSINLFNGNLNIAIPIGIKYPLARDFGYQFSLNYNSQAWDIDQPATTITAMPTRHANAGFGWDLSFGRLIPPASNGTLTGRWLYISPDGTQHPFFSNLHSDMPETDPDDLAMYTRDGSYYRMYASSTTVRLIEAPDGTQSQFQLSNGQWRLTQIGDRFNNRLWFNYSTPNVWVITDNHGRTQTLYFKADPTGYYPAIVDRLVLATFNGTTATYTFNYTSAHVARPSIDNDPATSATINLPQLTGITAPDGSQHLFTYHAAGATDFAGRLASMRLPTMGKIEWTYQSYAYITPGNPTVLGALFRQTTGVATRRMINSTGAVDGIWTYTPGLKPQGTEERELSNTVKNPLGDKTVYYFSVNTTSNGPEWIKSEYGLPFTKNAFDRPRDPTNNIALASRGALASASSTVNSGYPASAAINGDRKGLNWGNGGGWEDGTTNYFPDWLQVDFSASKTIDRINVFTSQDNYNNPIEPTPELTFASRGIRDFIVQYWNGSDWVNIPDGSVVNNDKVWRQFAFAPITTAKIRVLVSRATMSSRIAEVEAFESSLPAGTRFLAKQVYDCDSAGNNCQLLRSTYARYEQDKAGDPASPEVANTNRREASNRIVYHDDVENAVARFADTDKSNFDGLGHYRQITTNGNFGSGDVRTIFIDYDAATGTYPSATYQMPSPSTVWLPNIFALQKVTEGLSAQFIEFCYDRSNGFLRRLRRWWTTSASGGRSANDVMTVYTPDTSGQVAREQYYGGDIQLLGTQPLCSLALPGSEQYQLQHIYSYGSRAGAQYYTSSGTAYGAKFIDCTIDRNTGFVTTSRDSASITTGYDYDLMGRQTWVKPETGQGAWKQFTYTPATVAEAARKYVYDKSNGGGAVLTYNADIYDSFGRLWWQQTSVQGSYPNRFTIYNAMGWMTHKSEFNADTPKYTQYLNYDPFGRTGIERPPDGQKHDISYEYKGAFSVKRTVQVGYNYNPSNGEVYEVPRATTQIYDRQGKLWKNIAHHGASGNGLDQVVLHSYDAAGHLTDSRRDGQMASSYFAYDGRGFLFYTTDQIGQPRYFSNFDALGNALKQRHVNVDLTYVYDPANRLVRVQYASDPSKILKEFVYADANGTNDRRAGKLWTTKRYNYFPNNPIAVVNETYTYAGQGGRVSAYEIELNDGVHAPEKFAQTYTYNELGTAIDLGYASSISSGGGNLNRDRVVSNTYSGSYLTGVAGTINGQGESWAPSITYHANGLDKTISHANGVIDNIDTDPDGFPRVASVSTSGVKRFYPQIDDNFLPGDFQYDGLKSVVRIGKQYFVSSENFQLPPAPQIPNNPAPLCPQGLFDPFGLLSSSSSDCTPLTFMAYTANDRRVMIEDRMKDTRTWSFYGLQGQVLTEYTRRNVLGTWISTVDHIYRANTRLATVEHLQNAPSSKITHFHVGYGATGIRTDANGYKVRD